MPEARPGCGDDDARGPRPYGELARDDLRAEFARLRARSRARLNHSRELMVRARTNAQILHRRAQAATLAARERLIGRTVGLGFPALDDQSPGRDSLPRENVLSLVLDTTQEFFSGCAAVSMTIVDQLTGDCSPSGTIASSALAEAVDAAQLALREGPAVEAAELDARGAVHAGDLAAAEDARVWPAFSAAAVALGVRTALCVSLPWSPLRAGLQRDQQAVAAINIYGRAPHDFVQPEDTVLLFGTWVGSALTGRGPGESLAGD